MAARTTKTPLTPEETAAAARAREELNTARDELRRALEAVEGATAALRDAVLAHRPTGVLTVQQMADACGRDRNFIDSVWSLYGGEKKSRGQTRTATAPATEAERQAVTDELARLSKAHRDAVNAEKAARAKRDLTLSSVYAAEIKGVGPGVIADESDIDRNHVGRISRKMGVGPVYRTDSRNQYSPKD